MDFLTQQEEETNEQSTESIEYTILEELAKKYRYRIFRSDEYKLHNGIEHEYDLELHLKGDKESFISLYSPTILYVYIFKRPSLIKNLES
ncbi:MAG: hypothetical protein QXH07_05945 [Thermoplasmata archaeon]